MLLKIDHFQTESGKNGCQVVPVFSTNFNQFGEMVE